MKQKITCKAFMTISIVSIVSIILMSFSSPSRKVMYPIVDKNSSEYLEYIEKVEMPSLGDEGEEPPQPTEEQKNASEKVMMRLAENDELIKLTFTRHGEEDRTISFSFFTDPDVNFNNQDEVDELAKKWYKICFNVLEIEEEFTYEIILPEKYLI